MYMDVICIMRNTTIVQIRLQGIGFTNLDLVFVCTHHLTMLNSR